MARLLYVVHQFLPRYFTGTEQYTLAIAAEMRRRGHDVAVLALEPDFSERTPFFEWRDDPVGDLPVTRARVWYHLDRDYEHMEFRHPWLAARFRQLLEERRPDVVHVFHLRYLGVDLLHEARAAGVPTVVHLMDFWFVCPAVTLQRGDGALCDGPPRDGAGCIPCLRPDLARALDSRGLTEVIERVAGSVDPDTPPRSSAFGRAMTLLKRPAAMRNALATAARVVAPSRFLRDTFVRNGHAGDRIDVVGYGLDTAALTPLRAARAPRASGAPLRCGFVGSIAPHKGTHVAVAAVRAAGAGVELTVHGRLDDFADYARPLAAQAASEPRLRFPGPFDTAGRAAAFAAMDVLLVPSEWYENTPFVVLEAFAAGVPVLASDLGGLAELVADGVHGELFRPGDTADLAGRLQRLRDEPDRLERYRANLPAVKTLAANADEIERIYGEVQTRSVG
ncbi:MAG: glycosyltransferase family 4 protein [Planctomycetes bacterium]|nr:glycosyltransferase family 4 protein [Planctomycetota bacterium]